MKNTIKLGQVGKLGDIGTTFVTGNERIGDANKIVVKGSIRLIEVLCLLPSYIIIDMK